MKSTWLLLLALTPISTSLARDPKAFPESAQSAIQENPALETMAHDVGRLYLGMSNTGVFGPAEYPRGSFKQYLAEGGIWIGAVVNGDTLVSTGGGTYSGEFYPDPAPGGNIKYRSTLDPNSPFYEGAVSHEDYIAVFNDTCSTCPYGYSDEENHRHHIPLNIEVTQKSYAWMYDYAQDFVLLDYSIKNLGVERLREIYIGLYVDGDVHTTMPISGDAMGEDDQVGFIENYPATYMGESCMADSDLINMGWTADNDGNRWRPQDYAHVYDVLGVRIIRAPRDAKQVSFNWWAQGGWWDPLHDYGPQARGTYYPLSRGVWGTPYGDRARYHYLSNGERDYNQAYQAIMRDYDAEWVQPPPDVRDSIRIRMDPCFLLSFGPFALDPGQSLPFIAAVVAGTNFHRDGTLSRYLPDYPDAWYERIYLGQLVRNALWAQWIYDNPGVDTDSDGYAGDFNVCNAGVDSVWRCDTLIDSSADPDTNYMVCHWDHNPVDTIWRSGDGVPDLKGAYPPPNPSTTRFVNQHGDTIPMLRVYPEVGKIRLVWNGAVTENTPDPFSRRYDFEGYTVYISHDSRASSFSQVTTYDKENWFLWQWNTERRSFVCAPSPFTLEQLRCMYADSCKDESWHPDQYRKDNPLIIPGGPKREPVVIYFEQCGPNRSILANDPVNATTAIRKVYPHAPKPPFVDPDSIAAYFPNRDDTTYFTEEGFLKFYEYEYVFDGLLPTVSYYMNVTAFDHGFPGIGLLGLEGDPASIPKIVYPLPSSEVIKEQGLGVFVYPNPYRLDGDYRQMGYEGTLRWDLPDDKTRLIHFANLPPKCTIRIFTLNGDLIRELGHNYAPDDYLANHATWDLINRNSQLVVSGLYYWTVEDDNGNTQIGKLVIIM